VSDFDARLWRTLNRTWLVLTIGVLGLLVGLGPRPTRFAALLGLLLVALVALLVTATVLRMPAWARRALRALPRHRPLLALTALLLGCATVLVLCWAVTDLVFPGTLSPLSLALFGVIAAGILCLLHRLVRRA
jgi:hypothetical protein